MRTRLSEIATREETLGGRQEKGKGVSGFLRNKHVHGGGFIFPGRILPRPLALQWEDTCPDTSGGSGGRKS